MRDASGRPARLDHTFPNNFEPTSSYPSIMDSGDDVTINDPFDEHSSKKLKLADPVSGEGITLCDPFEDYVRNNTSPGAPKSRRSRAKPVSCKNLTPYIGFNLIHVSVHVCLGHH